VLVGVTYALIPSGSSSMGGATVGHRFAGGRVRSLTVFPFVESRVPDPMFRIDLFRNRCSRLDLGRISGVDGRGGVQIVLTILLQGIWLPLHGSATRPRLSGRSRHDPDDTGVSGDGSPQRTPL